MYKVLSECITASLVNHKIIDIKEQEFYVYGLELMLSKAVFYAVVIILSLLTNSFVVSILFLIAYMSLRQYTGGYHCKTSGLCFLLSVFIYLIMVLLYRLSFLQVEWILYGSAVLMLPVTVLFAPIESANKPITSDEWLECKRKSVTLTIVYLAIVLVSACFQVKVLFYPVSWTLTASAVLMIISKIRRENNEKGMPETDGEAGGKEH